MEGIMGRNRRIRIRQYHIWLRLLAKRLWRQPVYIGLLLLIPILGWAVSRIEQGEPGGAVVAVCVEEGAWSRQITDGLKRQEADSVLQFAFHDSAVDVEESVVRTEADCGFVIGADVAERVIGDDWNKCITVYETSESSITGMAKERIGVVIFRLYSEQRYEEYMKETAQGMREGNEISGETAQGTREGASDENAQEDQDGISGEMPQDISGRMVDFAKTTYENHLTDGSTFGFRYKNYDQNSQYSSDTNVISDTAVFPVKGLFAVIIFISGMCGMLEYDSDKREKRFLRLAPNALTYLVDIWMPTVFVSAAVLLCLWISDGVRYSKGLQGIGRLGGMLSVWSVGMWGSQILHLLFYQCVILLYCSILGIMLRRRETIAAAIPILSLGSLVCAPVFIRLSLYLPVFAVLEKLFPVTYYLAL